MDAPATSSIIDQCRLRRAIPCGDLPPGSALVETALATQFDVSRAPQREALRQLAEEGLAVTMPHAGTHVTRLSVDDLREPKARQATPTAAIGRGDDAASIDAELALHGLVHGASGHRLLQRTWAGLRGRLQRYRAAHHRTHGARGPPA
ncbi:MAG: GntR family transcriptional regulator [Rubrivivax sp.]